MPSMVKNGLDILYSKRQAQVHFQNDFFRTISKTGRLWRVHILKKGNLLEKRIHTHASVLMTFTKCMDFLSAFLGRSSSMSGFIFVQFLCGLLGCLLPLGYLPVIHTLTIATDNHKYSQFSSQILPVPEFWCHF